MHGDAKNIRGVIPEEINIVVFAGRIVATSPSSDLGLKLAVIDSAIPISHSRVFPLIARGMVSR